jgi:23S rRNA A2030 N6-methylase RlmJ
MPEVNQEDWPMSLQDHNAGNTGDQLKHALLLEVLARLPEDAPWGYVETHAGAGTYATPHTTALFRSAWVEAGVAPAERDPAREKLGPPAGWQYADALCRWWREQTSLPGLAPGHLSESAAMDLRYPGSAILALRSGAVRGPVSLIDADLAVVRRLRTALDQLIAPRLPAGDGWPGPSSRIQVFSGSFEDHLERLASATRLVVLVDPYYYLREALDCREGQLGLKHLRMIFPALDQRDAVLLVFTSSPPSGMLTIGDAGLLSGGTWKGLLADARALAPPALRCYRAADSPHAVLVAGWGVGKALVRELPGASSWERSWLAQPPLQLRVVEEAGR